MILTSLRIRLFCWLFVPLGSFVVISGGMALQNARATADLLQDSALLASVRIIGEDINWEDRSIIASVPPAALELFESPAHDSVFYKVVDAQGRLLAGNPALPLAGADDAAPTPGMTSPAASSVSARPAPATASDTLSAQPPRFYFTHFDGGPVLRAVTYTRRLYDSGQTHDVRVVVAKTQRARDMLVEQLWRPTLLRLVVMLALAMILVLLALTVELRPLLKLKGDLIDRTPSQLQPIRADRLHQELRPIVEAINHCIAKIGRQAALQRQFISDAAHQLRTPLTLLDTQIQFARQLPPGDRLADALSDMARSSQRAAQLTGKLLLLAQAESLTPADHRVPVDLQEVVTGVFEELIWLAQQRNIDLGAELDDTVVVLGDPALLAAMLMNLVDNALRYTQPGGRVTVSVLRRRGADASLPDSMGNQEMTLPETGGGGDARALIDIAEIRVIDNGPGISAEARPRVFERFYRAAPDTEGSGLGLAIVREIVQRHRGTVSVAPGPDGVGLIATVRLRCAPPLAPTMASTASTVSPASAASAASATLVTSPASAAAPVVCTATVPASREAV